MNVDESLRGEMAFGYHYSSRIDPTQIFSEVERKKRAKSWANVEFKEYSNVQKVSLPIPTHQTWDFIATLRSRHSSRNYRDRNISLVDLSTLLYYSAGILSDSSGAKLPGAGYMSRRAYPSAGARYPLEVYVIWNSHFETKSGVYHYNVKTHCLELVKDCDPSTNLQEMTGEDWAPNAQFAIALTCVFSRVFAKYGERAYRYIMLEAGHVMQNFCLVSQSMHYGICPIGGFIDDILECLLGVDGTSEAALYLATIGGM